MRTRLVVLTLAAALLAAVLVPAGASAGKVPQSKSFLSPTGNIACTFGASGARCDIRAYSYKAPPVPKSCHLAWGDSLGVSTSGKGYFTCHGDTVFGKYPKLAYGKSETLGNITCSSATSGITCTDTKTKHGFFLSRASYRLF